MLDWLFGAPLPVGSTAPDFELADDEGTRWSLKSLHGQNVMLVFYPGDSTPGCTKQLCEIRDRWDLVKSHGVRVFGVNPRGQRSHANFRRRYVFPFPLLVDEGGRVSSQYRCGSVIVRRTVYLIGKDGKILFAERGMPSTGAVLQAAGIQ